MRKTPPDFLTAYLAGAVEAHDIIDYIATWHSLEYQGGQHTQSAHEWLGMTWGQYCRWFDYGELPTRTGAAEPPPPSPAPSDPPP